MTYDFVSRFRHDVRIVARIINDRVVKKPSRAELPFRFFRANFTDY